MLKPQRQIAGIAIAAGVSALVVGGCVAALQGVKLSDSSPTQSTPSTASRSPGSIQVKQINSLKSLPAAQRTTRLEAIAQKHDNRLERSRARYLLATEHLQQSRPKDAIAQLDGLEKDYPVLAAYVLLKRAQAYEQAGDRPKAEATWQALLQQHPNHPAAAEALYALGRQEARYWDQAIAQFPTAPRTVEIARQRLQQDPNDLKLLLLVARHGLYLSDYTDYLERLVKQHEQQLTPLDWQAIAFGYWEKQLYGKAAAAYARSPYTALNAYRVGRGMQLADQAGAAAAYQRMIASFPDQEETPLALMRLAEMLEPAQSLPYLDQVISRFPERAGQALLAKAKVLETLNNPEAAGQTRQLLLSRYGSSDAAAELRWQLAQERAKAGDLQAATSWAKPILKNNLDSEFAPEAGFWVGKWSNQLGKRREATTAFQQVLKTYPDSYYAWRSADMLGWQVGDFTSVRQLNPEVIRPAARPGLPVGSDALQELYQIGQDRDAWALWQSEFQTPAQPTVAQQFTDGVMRLGVGDYLDGIFMVSFLSQRETPQEESQYRDLKRQTAYWQALYPFPFLEPIEAWSQARQVNPLLVTALIRQESRFMPGIRSSAGAVGLMQVMPETGMWIAKHIQIKEYRLDDPEDNIKLGTWYLDHTHQEFNGNSMLAIASYNAGPGAVSDWVTQKGITDPDQFVEQIPYKETRGYVKSVFANYWNYLRLYNPEISQKMGQVTDLHPVETDS
ncbi:MAG TPA: transglycosylase SLT domain-containing protein [Coleofasciculaceae cyanobacterium]